MGPCRVVHNLLNLRGTKGAPTTADSCFSKANGKTHAASMRESRPHIYRQGITTRPQRRINETLAGVIAMGQRNLQYLMRCIITALLE
jgi:hypothetical protein